MRLEMGTQSPSLCLVSLSLLSVYQIDLESKVGDRTNVIMAVRNYRWEDTYSAPQYFAEAHRQQCRGLFLDRIV